MAKFQKTFRYPDEAISQPKKEKREGLQGLHDEKMLRQREAQKDGKYLTKTRKWRRGKKRRKRQTLFALSRGEGRRQLDRQRAL